MGWTFGPHDTPQTIEKRYTQGWNGMQCLDHAMVREDSRQVLWAAMEYTVDTERYPKGYRWILCVLIECHNGWWGEKSMSEDMGPFYYSCPTRLLDLVPPPQTRLGDGWRNQVIQYNLENRQ